MKRTNLFALVSTLAVLMTVGCTGSNKTFDWNWSAKAAPQSVDKVLVTKVHVDNLDQAPAHSPKQLRIDLKTGQALFTDSDGQAYPQRVPAQQAKALAQKFQGGTWVLSAKRPPRGLSDIQVYSVQPVKGSSPSNPKVLWTRPSFRAQGLPGIYWQLAELIDSADRRANPLSEEVDLVR